MKKKIEIATSISFISILFMGSLSYLWNPQKVFSELENRYLSQYPSFSIDSFFKGTWSKNIEEYMQDQIIFRDNLVMIHNIRERLLGKIESNGVYFGKDNYLIGDFKKYNINILKKNISTINNFSKPVSLMAIPSLIEVQKGLLPHWEYHTSQIQLSNQAKAMLHEKHQWIDTFGFLKNNNEAYYKLDHHWNTQGAYLASQKYLKLMGKTTSNYTFYPVTHDFRGTMYAKSGMFHYSGEAMNGVKELEELNVTVTFEDGKTSNSLFFDEHLTKKNTYAYFLDGNHSYVDIVNHDTKSTETLLVIKDSFAHNMIPFLVPQYERIVMIDLRYFHEPVSELVENINADEILMLYSIESLCTDKNIMYLT